MSALLNEHFGYLSDPVKQRRYAEAISAVVREGDVVLDLGCGSGVLGLACLRAGAGFVHAVDETRIIEVARRTLRDAGFGSRAAFHRMRSQHLALPAPVDVVVCDHVGCFGIDYGILDMLADAKQRLLKPGGSIIPAELRLSVAAVESATCRALVDRWRDERVPADYHWIGEIATATKHMVTLSRGDLFSDAVELGRIELDAGAPPFLSWTAALVANRDGNLDGIGGWFDCRLAADVWMTNSPRAADPLQRAQVFLPLEVPVPVRAGEPIRVTVMARPAESVLGWVVELPASGRRLAHSTWNGLLLDQQDLVRANPERVATLNRRGRARQVVLGYCDGVRTVAAVEQLVLREHPGLFPSPSALSAFVARVLSRDTQS